ncbi:cytochrome c oxidase subunit I [Sphingomonas sp. ID1715]|uniref:cytochrome c oxidase subunit I n=1 Tax=Sphingomonas sp. ID1715 TaxID=1656898 RepID=UPI00148912A1|nr:cytochrome c oxidase subunit I [Sphingomonas sp. ID1715]NNM76277.1 cytochrome c oxidase subunit I [Sphingomonas sp. ID1715]
MTPRGGVALQGPELHDRLYKTWSREPGLIGWLSSVDHKEIGRRYIITAFIFFALAGVLALVMRVQLATPESGLISADRYNQIFTMHGTTMMFLFAVPVMEAVAIYLVPLMLGTRNIAFPRLNAFSYYVYLAGGVMLWVAFAMNVGPDAGWFSYVPLSGPQYSPGKRVDFWAQMITFTEVAALAVSVELVATILKQRAPGMRLDRMPLFVWGVLVTSLMVIFSMPSVTLASSFLIADRLVGTHFFNPVEGGDPLLWQHLFWFFGHPEVYIIFLPAVGFVSQITETFTGRPVFGYPFMVLALVSIGLLAFGLWVHHMFAAGLPRLGYAFYTAASMTVSIPAGVQIFCWIATIWAGRPRFEVPLLYVIAFIVTFVIGGLSGVMVASVPLDLQMHDTYFVVAHFHYVLIGGGVFPLLGAVTYWFPKITGRMMSETLGRWSFGLLFVGFNLTFMPMHWTGLMGMPRRVYTYPAGMGWDMLNLLSTVGAFLTAVAVLLFAINVLRSWKLGAIAGSNPWNAATLEWSTTSPPQPYNFAHIPVVESRTPLWDMGDQLPVMTGLRVDERETLLTSVIDAAPDLREPSPEPTIWPLWAALFTTALFVGSIFTPWAIVYGAVPVALVLIAWFWPKLGEPAEEPVMR